MRGHAPGHPIPCHDDLVDDVRGHGVEARRRLVVEDDLGLRDETPREPRALAHPPRELVRPEVARAAQVHEVERAVDAAVERIKDKLLTGGAKEVASTRLGELVMRELKRIDKVAYVRFASVYRSFEDVDEFRQLIRDI